MYSKTNFVSASDDIMQYAGICYAMYRELAAMSVNTDGTGGKPARFTPWQLLADIVTGDEDDEPE